MSERIREPYYSLMYKASIGWNEHLFQVPPELLEKFADSIVKECLNTIKSDWNEINLEADTQTIYTLGVIASVRDACAAEIRNRFGLEEPIIDKNFPQVRYDSEFE